MTNLDNMSDNEIQDKPIVRLGEESKGAILKQDNEPPYLRYFNRELSWLHFNSRVLRQATDDSLPILERLRFLSIFQSNLDEFFMKRVGGLKRHIAAGIIQRSMDGLTPKEQLKAIRQVLMPQINKAASIFKEELCPALEDVGIELLKWENLTKVEQSFCADYFNKKVFPLLTPLSVDIGHPFPLLSNLSTSLGIALRYPEKEELQFARVKISDISPQWIRVAPENHDHTDEIIRLLPINELVLQFLPSLFPEMVIVGSMLFRITRNIEIEVDEEDAEDLIELMEEELRQRRRAMVIKLDHGVNPDTWILEFLKEELSLHKHDIYQLDSLLDYTSLAPIINLKLPELCFKPLVSLPPVCLREEPNIFNAIKAHDLMVHHPFESFSASVERFVREAAEDSSVKAIKMTVYRVGDNTPIIPLLIQAAERGKDVVCFVELKARFDEERNMEWAQQLEENGVHVIYGMSGLKIHAKALLVVRDEADKARCYAHISTGNYHSLTSNLYTDIGLFTCKDHLTQDLLDLFNHLTGRSIKNSYDHILVAPYCMEDNFLKLIDQESQNAEMGKQAHIVAKMNSLEDREIIDALYAASNAGVKIQLFVRGVCSLRPGVKGLSENISVISIIGRLLEHSRMFYFRAGQDDPVDGKFFISSADWMSRNMHRRIEVAVPIEDRPHRERLWGLIQVLEQDKALSWLLNTDGSYSRIGTALDRDICGTHEVLMRRSKA